LNQAGRLVARPRDVVPKTSCGTTTLILEGTRVFLGGLASLAALLSFLVIASSALACFLDSLSASRSILACNFCSSFSFCTHSLSTQAIGRGYNTIAHSVILGRSVCEYSRRCAVLSDAIRGLSCSRPVNRSAVLEFSVCLFCLL
jgi:hypothetical protein